MCLVAFAALTSVLITSYASRGDGQWQVMDDPQVWIWTGLGAFAIGFWGFGSILVSALSPKPLGRVMFMVLGGLYLAFAAWIGFDEWQYGSPFDLGVDALVWMVGSAILMVPLMLLVMFIGRMAE